MRLARPLLFAFALLAGLVPVAGALFSNSAKAQTIISDPETCRRRAEASPQQTLPLAKAWEEAGGGNAARHCIAYTLSLTGEWRGAAHIFSSLADEMNGFYRKHPDSDLAGTVAPLYGQAAQAWLQADEPEKALAALDSALALKPKDESLHIDRLVALGQSGDFEGAVSESDAILDLDPKSSDAWLYRAGALREMGLPDQALDAIGEAMRLKPDDPAILLERGSIRRAAGDGPGARADWQKVLDVAPATPEATLAGKNLSMLRKGS
jgi:tetratricopeptide (TPR) repeat protein